MQCPDCGFDNIEGSEICEACGASLSALYPQGTEVERGIASHSVLVLVPREPVSVASDTRVRDVIQLMVDKNIGCVLVQDEGQLRGVFSERDVLNRITSDTSRLDHPVSQYMSAPPVTIERRDSIAYALQCMDSGGYRHLPIVDAHRQAQGMISVRDILRFLCVKYAQSRS